MPDNEPVTQSEFSSAMTAIKQDFDELREDIASLKRNDMRILDLLEGIDKQLKTQRDLPARVTRLEREVFP